MTWIIAAVAMAIIIFAFVKSARRPKGGRGGGAGGGYSHKPGADMPDHRTFEPR